MDSAGPYANWTHLSVTGITDVWNSAWVEIDVANNQLINFTTPDFSSAGGPIEFGYYTFNWSLPQGFLIDSTWGIDNFSVQVNADTPEPACSLLDQFGGAGILGISRRLCMRRRLPRKSTRANRTRLDTGTLPGEEQLRGAVAPRLSY